jgi:hypothetical protein
VITEAESDQQSHESVRQLNKKTQAQMQHKKNIKTQDEGQSLIH